MKNKIFALLSVFFVLFTVTATATEAENLKGFYDIGTHQNIVITPYSADLEVDATIKNLDSDADMEQLYENSDRLEVSYTGATSGDYYGVLLVEGNTTPTKDTRILYINQLTAEADTIDFNVYPILPKKATPLTLYISSNAQEFDLVKVSLNYYLPAADYVLGDVNNDGEYDVKDALIALQIGVGKFDDHPDAAALRVSADVNNDGECDVKDALLILQRGIGKIESFN